MMKRLNSIERKHWPTATPRTRRRGLRHLATVLLAASATTLGGCELLQGVFGGGDKEEELCMTPSNIEWDSPGTTASTYLSDDTTLGYSNYPEGPTYSEGSACYLTLQSTNCQGQETNITNTFAEYSGDTHIDDGNGTGNFRIASISFDGDVAPISQFNSTGSGTEGSTAHFNGERTVPQYVTVVSAYPLSTPPANGVEGEDACMSHVRATFRLE